MISSYHSKFHPSTAFCGNAGPEEMAHLQNLVSILSDEELKVLVERVGIKFMADQKDISRYDYENVINEVAKEDFYREYKKILESRSKIQ